MTHLSLIERMPCLRLCTNVNQRTGYQRTIGLTKTECSSSIDVTLLVLMCIFFVGFSSSLEELKVDMRMKKWKGPNRQRKKNYVCLSLPQFEMMTSSPPNIVSKKIIITKKPKNNEKSSAGISLVRALHDCKFASKQTDDSFERLSQCGDEVCQIMIPESTN
jgi:hypothetical protein